MTPTRTLSFPRASLAAALLALTACSKEAPTPTSTTTPAPATAAAADPASSPLPGVIGQPSDVAAQQTPTSPADGQTAVGQMTTHPEQGTSKTGDRPAPTGGDASPRHAASSASQ